MTVDVRRFGIEQIAELYPAMYAEVAGERPPFGHCPAVVYVATVDGEYRGFAAGYAHDLNTFYIQFVGPKPGTPIIVSMAMLREVLKAIAADGYRFITAAIYTDNTPAIRAALAHGFAVNGMRVATNGKIAVELLREAYDGIS